MSTMDEAGVVGGRQAATSFTMLCHLPHHIFVANRANRAEHGAHGRHRITPGLARQDWPPRVVADPDPRDPPAARRDGPAPHPLLSIAGPARTLWVCHSGFPSGNGAGTHQESGHAETAAGI